MYAAELRIGNWLMRSDGSEFQVDWRDIKIISEWGNPFAILPQKIKLTEERIFKFGWTKIENDIKTYWKPNWIIDVDAHGNFFVVKGGKVILEYVHQFQNLYFALEGKELK